MKKIDDNISKLTEYIFDFSEQNGYLPSVREMASFLDIKSTSTISYYLNVLEKRNILKRNSVKNKARAFELIKPEAENSFEEYDPTKFTRIPLVGTITAGNPILAVENFEETFAVPTSLFKGDDLFMLTVNGESMINAGILDGDLIIVHKQSYADNGEIVAALINDRATVKRFYKEKDRFRLQPENPNMEPIYTDEVSILGKVVGVIRKSV